MNWSRRFALRARWAIPGGTVAAVGLVVAGSMIAGAAAAPALPPRTAAQLLADIAGHAAAPSSLSGVIASTASLGLPQLPDGISGMSGYSLLAGSHTIKFWYADPAHVRIAIPVSMGETDVRRDGRQVWLWDSTSQTATHIVLPARSGHDPAAGDAGTGPAGALAPTPQQAARQVLAAVGPTTAVSVQQNVMVAGQAAYQLAIAPKDKGSLIGQIRIAVDAHGYLPLRLQVFARGAASPAYQVGFTALSFARPAASNFTFTPPPGAKVKNATAPGIGWHAAAMPGRPLARASFSDRPALRNHPKSGFWSGYAPGAVSASGAARALPPRCALARGAVTRGAQTGGAVTGGAVTGGAVTGGAVTGGAQTGGALAGGALTGGALAGGALAGGAGPAVRQAVIGQGWLSVLVLSSPMPGSSSASTAYSSTVTASAGPSGADLALLPALLRAATPVHGSWGSGRLLRTSLLSVLLTNNGHVLIGAVTPSVLYADAAKVK
jgi:outer membrane lipoprotein-sorting protein